MKPINTNPTICKRLGDAIFDLLPVDGSPVSLGRMMELTQSLVTDTNATAYYAKRFGKQDKDSSRPLLVRISLGHQYLIRDRLNHFVSRGAVTIEGDGVAAMIRRASKVDHADNKAGDIIDVPLSKIRIDGGTQSRCGLRSETVSEYAEIVKASAQTGKRMDPGEALSDGEWFWLWDGFHRFEAHRVAGVETMLLRVRTGTVEEARWLAAGANVKHGLRRTNKDKRTAVELALRTRWSESDRAIAEWCGVSHSTVVGVRNQMASGQIDQMPPRTVERGGKTYTMNTAAINAGRRRTPPASSSTTEASPPTSSPQTVDESDDKEEPSPPVSIDPAPAPTQETTLTPISTPAPAPFIHSQTGDVVEIVAPPATAPSPPTPGSDLAALVCRLRDAVDRLAADESLTVGVRLARCERALAVLHS